MATISKLGYLGFEVSDVAAWERFLVEALGLLGSGRKADGSASFRIDDQAQRIVVYPGARDDLAYAGFEVDDEKTLRQLSEQLNRAGFPTTDLGDEVARARRAEPRERSHRGALPRRHGEGGPARRLRAGALRL